MTLGKNDQMTAFAEGVRDAVLTAMRSATDMPGQDTFHFIKEGVKEATTEWLNQNREAIIAAIAELAAAH